MWRRYPGLNADADLFSTLFAIGALRIAGVAAEDPVIRKALAFVERCQNFAADEVSGDSRFDDGGFFFTTKDPAREGEAGVRRGLFEKTRAVSVDNRSTRSVQRIGASAASSLGREERSHSQAR
jgi:hypothetical protein